MSSLKRWRQIGQGQFHKWETPGDELEVEDHGHATSLDLTSLAGAGALEQPLLSGALGAIPRREALRVLRALSILGEPGSLRAALPYLIELH